MKLSWLPVSLFEKLISGEMPLALWLEQAVTLGLDGVDASIIFFRGAENMNPDEFRDEIGRRNLTLAVFNTYPDFTNPDGDIRKRELSGFADDVVIASRAGAKMIRVTAGQSHPGLSRGEGIARAVEGLRQAGEIAAESGIRAVYENHSRPGVWKYGDFSHPSDIFIEIAEKLAGARLGILFDTANADARGDSPLEILERVKYRIECVHVADTSRRDRLEPSIIGRGVVDFDAIFGELDACDYDGWFSIEDASGDSEGIIKAVEFVRRHWR